MAAVTPNCRPRHWIPDGPWHELVLAAGKLGDLTDDIKVTGQLDFESTIETIRIAIRSLEP